MKNYLNKYILLILILSFSYYLIIDNVSKNSIDPEIDIIKKQDNFIILTDTYNLNISDHGGTIIGIYPNGAKNLLVDTNDDNMGIKYFGTAHLHYDAPRWYDQYYSIDIRNQELEISELNVLENNGNNLLINVKGKTGDLNYNIIYNFGIEYFYVNTTWELRGFSIFSILQYVIPFDINGIDEYEIIGNDTIIMKKDSKNIVRITENRSIPMVIWTDDSDDEGKRYSLNFHLDNPDKYNTVRLSHSKGNFSFKFEFLK